MPVVNEVLSIIGEIVAYGGGAALIAYFTFQFLGKTWIENQFARSLERHRHQQAIELQRLRVEIDSVLSGRIRLQEKEYETLPVAWDRLYDARRHVVSLLSPFQSYPDSSRMSDEQIEEFLERSELLGWQKNEIRNSADKSTTYQKLIFFHRLSDTRNAYQNFHMYASKNAIFFPEDIKELMDRASELLWSATTSKEIGNEAGDFKIAHEGWQKIQNEFEPLFKEIETKIHKRLQQHSRTES